MSRRAAAALLVAGALMAGCASLEGTRLYNSGTRALDRGDAHAAVLDLERAAQLIPESAPIFNHLGIAYKESGRFDDALRAFQRAVDLDCDNRAAAQNLRAAQAHAAARGR